MKTREDWNGGVYSVFFQCLELGRMKKENRTVLAHVYDYDIV